MHISEQKSELRAAINERLARMTAEDRAAESRSLCRRLLPEIPHGATVCAYAALPSEPDLDLLLRALWERGDSVFLPAFRDNRLVFRTATKGDVLKPGPLRIPEPPADAPELPEGGADIAIVPGRAFDSEGRRLGRGNGGYDIWIARQRAAGAKTRFIGACFECQLVRDIPMEAHDQRVDAVATAREYFSVDNPRNTRN